MTSTTRILLGVIALIVVVAVVTHLNRLCSSGTGLVADVEQTERPVQVHVIRPQSLTESLEYTGPLAADRDAVLAAEGRADRRVVELGPRIDDQVIARSGLQSGARVIVVGHENLRHGNAVLAASASSAAAGDHRHRHRLPGAAAS